MNRGGTIPTYLTFQCLEGDELEDRREKDAWETPVLREIDVPEPVPSQAVDSEPRQVFVSRRSAAAR